MGCRTSRFVLQGGLLPLFFLILFFDLGVLARLEEGLWVVCFCVLGIYVEYCNHSYIIINKTNIN